MKAAATTGARTRGVTVLQMSMKNVGTTYIERNDRVSPKRIAESVGITRSSS